MEIKQSEWKDFAEFIANTSTHPCDDYLEDGYFTCCPFSTIELAYKAFKLHQDGVSLVDIRKLYDVDYELENPRVIDYYEHYHDYEEEDYEEPEYEPEYPDEDDYLYEKEDYQEEEDGDTINEEPIDIDIEALNNALDELLSK